MKWSWKLAASLATVAAFSVIAVAAATAANPHQMYTCVKVTPGGEVVQVEVPEPAVKGLTKAGYTCVPNPPSEEEDPGNEDPGDEGPGDAPGPGSSASAPASAPEAQRTVFCSTNGHAFRANGDGMGIALNLIDEQGALLVERGLVVPAMYYQGLGASCDVLPGYSYAGTWVDHVGDVVPGVAVYPLFIRASAG
jgi:hypothetical protein